MIKSTVEIRIIDADTLSVRTLIYPLSEAENLEILLQDVSEFFESRIKIEEGVGVCRG